MFVAIGLMVVGGIVGFLLRNKKIEHVPKIVTVLIWILLFILGLEVGGNPQVISSLMDIGKEALVITFCAVLGSTIAAWLLWKYVTNKRKKPHEE